MLRMRTCASQHCHWGVIRSSANPSRSLTSPAGTSCLNIEYELTEDSTRDGLIPRVNKKERAASTLDSILGVRINPSSL